MRLNLRLVPLRLLQVGLWRALGWLLVSTLTLALAPMAARADALPSPAWTLITNGPLPANRPPVAALDRRGQSHLLWLEPLPEGDLARLMWAASPVEPPLVLAEALPLERTGGLAPQHPGYALTTGAHPWAAWSGQEGETRTVTSVSLDGHAGQTWQVPAKASFWTFALDAQGALLTAWFASDGLHVHLYSQGLTITLPVEANWVAGRLQVALDDQGQGYVAWSGRGQEPGSGGVWYAPLAEGASPFQAVSEGVLADMAVGPDGALHLAWYSSDGLYYVNNQTRDSRKLVAPGLSGGAPVALAAAQGGIGHLAWLQEGRLWLAVSADWQLSRMIIAEPDAGLGLDLAVDAWGAPHLLWAEEGSETRSARLGLWRPLAPAPSLKVTWPVEGQVLTGDSLVQVAANRPPADWQRIEFYLQEEGPAGGQTGVLSELGIARDGTDGWRTPLYTEGLDPTRRYRIVALGVGLDARVTRAVGGWFRAASGERLWLWPQPWRSEVSGLVTLAISPPPGAERLARLDLYLTSAHTRALLSSGWDAAPPPADHFVSLPVEGSLDRPVARLDTRTLPDGRFHISARGHTADGQILDGHAFYPLVIDNTLPPILGEITAGLLDATTGELEILARAGAPHRQPKRVAFYLQRDDASLFGGQEPAFADLAWAGGGQLTDKGWRVVVTPEPYWYDQRWIIWAVACDERDVCASAPSDEPRILWRSDRPALLLAQPTGVAPLQGVEPVRLAIATDTKQVVAASVWLEHPGGDLTLIGEMEADDHQWSLRWDTGAHRDGAYRLLALVTLDDDAELTVWSPPLTVANRQPAWRMTAPSIAQQVRGWTPISLAPLDEGEPIQRITLYHRDAGGALAAIGAARPHQGQWSLLWNTQGALDGNNVLVAAIETAKGETYYLEHPVEVQNARPSISLLRGSRVTPVSGLERTVWHAQHPAGKPLTVTVEYSPDAGGHWLPVARDLAEGISLSWDSSSLPDSDAAYLRLTATDGQYHRQTSHGPFVVSNVNDAPSVTLARPRPGDTLGRSAVLAWQAADADADLLSVALYYRRDAGPWQLLAEGLPAVGRYEWDTSGLTPAAGYAVRALARDPAGAAGVEIVEGIAIVDNAPPVVNLVWPNDDVRLSNEAVILWRSQDPDGDSLTVDLYYSDNSGLTWFPLAENLPDSGYYVWQLSFLPPGNAYRLKVVAHDGHASSVNESRGVFTLGPELPPLIELLAPGAGDTLMGLQPVRWWTVGPIPAEVEVDVLTRLSVWGEWRTLAEGLAPNETYLWDTRRSSDGVHDLLVRVRLGDQRSLSNIAPGLRVRNTRERPLEIALLSPLGGELWSELGEVRWRLSGAEGRALVANLELSPDAGKTWRPLATVNADQGRYLWQTGDWPTGQRYLLRITATDGEATATAASAGAFSLGAKGGYPPHLTITSPTPEGALAGGSLITWIADDADDDPLLIDILLSDDGGRTWRQIATRLLNTGEYPLDAPFRAEGDYRVALVACDGLHRIRVESGPLQAHAIERLRPRLEIAAPGRGVVATGSLPILWEASDPASLRLLVDIAYSGDGGQTWQEAASDLPNTGRFDWDTTLLANGAYFLRVTVDNGRLSRSVVGEPVTVANPGNAPPYLSWAGAGLAIPMSGAYEIVWRARDAGGDALTLALEYSLGPHGPWMPLAHGIENTGRYLWDASAAPSADDVWLRLTATDGRFETALISETPLTVRHAGSPRVQLLAPQGGEGWTGKHMLRWRVTDNGAQSQVTLQSSLDGGRTWANMGAGLPALGSYLWDTAQVADGSAVLLRVLATRGAHEGAVVSAAPVVVRGNEPRHLLPHSFR